MCIERLRLLGYSTQGVDLRKSVYTTDIFLLGFMTRKFCCTSTKRILVKFPYIIEKAEE